ncbi:MAG: glutamine--fructose-6-phosphate aminotransferase, partial [Acidobacteria bacterium]
MAEKREFPHHMIKEIFEQPQGLHDTIAPRISLPEGVVQLNEVPISRQELRSLTRINIVASGTSRHAGMVGQYMIQELAGIPADVDYASEFEYRNPMIGRGELTIVITQSGETADTGAAQREAKARGSRTVAISNVAGTTIAREADGVIYTLAGPEISIASTKAFTAQMAALLLFALHLAQARETLSPDLREHYIRELLELPAKLKTLLGCADQCEQIATEFHKVDDFLFLGRAIHYPIAMDGALKLKEVSYVHAEGYPTGETKHGPNALIDENLPVVIIATHDPESPGSVLRYEK